MWRPNPSIRVITSKFKRFVGLHKPVCLRFYKTFYSMLNIIRHTLRIGINNFFLQYLYLLKDFGDSQYESYPRNAIQKL
jgi:hypothetical protein